MWPGNVRSEDRKLSTKQKGPLRSCFLHCRVSQIREPSWWTPGEAMFGPQPLSAARAYTPSRTPFIPPRQRVAPAHRDGGSLAEARPLPLLRGKTSERDTPAVYTATMVTGRFRRFRK